MASSLRTILPRTTRTLTRNTLQTTRKCIYPVCPQQHRFQSSNNLRAPDALDPKLTSLDLSGLSISPTTTPKAVLPAEELVFGRTFTDHMLSIEWTAADGWLPPRITPYQNLSLDPATCVFHYGFECFEGMKAYKDQYGNVRLFRPDKNMERMNKSAARIALPTFDGQAMINLIAGFVKMEQRFIPDKRGYSLYLRPTIIGTQRTLGVGPPGSALFYVIASPVGPYYPTGFKAINLEATSYVVRAWPGGAGNYKLGGNYAPCIVPQMQAASRGLHQNLWLFEAVDPETGRVEDYITEVGTMNLFVALQHKDGSRELVTAPLDGTILEGVTRLSVLELARQRMGPEGWTISERKLTMREIVEAAGEGRLLEVFGSGTAAIVSPVRGISYQNQMIDCGLPEGQEAGPIAKQMKEWIEAIQYGDEENSWSVKIADLVHSVQI